MHTQPHSGLLKKPYSPVGFWPQFLIQISTARLYGEYTSFERPNSGEAHTDKRDLSRPTLGALGALGELFAIFRDPRVETHFRGILVQVVLVVKRCLTR